MLQILVLISFNSSSISQICLFRTIARKWMISILTAIYGVCWLWLNYFLDVATRDLTLEPKGFPEEIGDKDRIQDFDARRSFRAGTPAVSG